MILDAWNVSASVFHFFNKSLEESIWRREFRLRPDLSHPLGKPVPKLMPEALKARLAKTAKMVRTGLPVSCRYCWLLVCLLACLLACLSRSSACQLTASTCLISFRLPD